MLLHVLGDQACGCVLVPVPRRAARAPLHPHVECDDGYVCPCALLSWCPMLEPFLTLLDQPLVHVAPAHIGIIYAGEPVEDSAPAISAEAESLLHLVLTNVRV